MCFRPAGSLPPHAASQPSINYINRLEKFMIVIIHDIVCLCCWKLKMEKEVSTRKFVFPFCIFFFAALCLFSRHNEFRNSLRGEKAGVECYLIFKEVKRKSEGERRRAEQGKRVLILLCSAIEHEDKTKKRKKLLHSWLDLWDFILLHNCDLDWNLNFPARSSAAASLISKNFGWTFERRELARRREKRI